MVRALHVNCENPGETMYKRHNSGNITNQIFAAAALIISIAIVFMLFQKLRTPSNTAALPTQTALPAAQATATAPMTSVMVPAEQVRLVADKAGINTSVVEVYFGRTTNWDITKLGAYAGHLEGTSRVGEKGNTVLIGHIELKDGTRGAFAHLDRLKKGDQFSVIVTKGEKVNFISYTVTDLKTVATDDMQVLADHGFDELTLLTCYEWTPDQGIYKSRLILQARPTQRSAAAASKILPPK